MLCTFVKQNQKFKAMQLIQHSMFKQYPSDKLLGKANKIVVVGVHVGQFNVNKQFQLILRLLFTFSNTHVDDSLHFFT